MESSINEEHSLCRDLEECTISWNGGKKNPNPLIIDLLESIDHNAKGEFQHLIFLDCVFYLFTLL